MSTLTIDQQRAEYLSRIARVDKDIDNAISENLREGLDNLWEERIFYCQCLESLDKAN